MDAYYREGAVLTFDLGPTRFAKCFPVRTPCISGVIADSLPIGSTSFCGSACQI